MGITIFYSVMVMASTISVGHHICMCGSACLGICLIAPSSQLNSEKNGPLIINIIPGMPHLIRKELIPAGKSDPFQCLLPPVAGRAIAH
jgi:hypothetical protein